MPRSEEREWERQNVPGTTGRSLTLTVATARHAAAHCP